MRCPHCNQLLSDDWLRSAGAAAMGRRGGKKKPAKAGAKLAAANRVLKTKWSAPAKT